MNLIEILIPLASSSIITFIIIYYAGKLKDKKIEKEKLLLWIIRDLTSGSETWIFKDQFRIFRGEDRFLSIYRVHSKNVKFTLVFGNSYRINLNKRQSKILNTEIDNEIKECFNNSLNEE